MVSSRARDSLLLRWRHLDDRALLVRSARLQSAVTWLKQFSGKNVLRGYCKHYGVDYAALHHMECELTWGSIVNKRLLNEFLSLPVNSDETWQGGGVPMADVLSDPFPDAAELALVLWCSTSTDLVHAKPAEIDLDGLMEVMLEFWSMHEFPLRPARTLRKRTKVQELLLRERFRLDHR